MERAGAFPAAEGGELDFASIGRALWRRKWRILGPTLLIALVTAIGVNFITPRYKSEARILYDGRENVFLRPSAERSVTERGAADQEALASQVQLILSRELALQVIKELKLTERPEFDPLINGISPLKRIMALIGFARDPARMTPEERVLESYYERLSAYTVERSRVIIVEFWSYDPTLAAKAVNSVVEGYLGLQQSAKQDDMRASSQWLSGEIEVLRRKVADAEARAEEFRSRANLFVGANNTTLSNQQLGEFNSQLASARGQKSDAETRARLIRDMLRRGEPIEASEIVNSELVRRLSEQRVALRAQLAEQYSTLLDAHPRIKELKAQLADLDRQIRSEAEKLVRTLENDSKIADARVEALTANLESLKRVAASTNEDDVRLRALEREARAQRELLESYLGRFREASARENIGSAPADARIISRGIVSNTPYFPKKLPIVLIATLATLVIASALVATGELVRANEARYASPAPMPVMPIMPDMMRFVQRLAPERMVLADLGPEIAPALAPAPADEEASAPAPAPEATSPAALGSVEELAAKLRDGGTGRCVAFFGLPGETIALATALAASRLLAREQLVALVSVADEPPACAIDPDAPGVTDLIAGTASFGEVIARDRQSRAHVVPRGRSAMPTAEIVGSLRFVTMIDALTRTYDLVLIAAGPVATDVVEKMVAVAPSGVLVVSETDDPAVLIAQQRLDAAGRHDALMLVHTPAATPRPEAA